MCLVLIFKSLQKLAWEYCAVNLEEITVVLNILRLHGTWILKRGTAFG